LGHCRHPNEFVKLSLAAHDRASWEHLGWKSGELPFVHNCAIHVYQNSIIGRPPWFGLESREKGQQRIAIPGFTFFPDGGPLISFWIIGKEKHRKKEAV
jgi:hypothetical protein